MALSTGVYSEGFFLVLCPIAPPGHCQEKVLMSALLRGEGRLFLPEQPGRAALAPGKARRGGSSHIPSWLPGIPGLGQCEQAFSSGVHGACLAL